MLSYYRKIWADQLDGNFSKGSALFTLLTIFLIPALLGYGVYNPDAALAVFIGFVGIAGLVLFYNVRTFGFYILPLYFLILGDRLFFALIILLLVTYLADSTNRSNFEVKLPFAIWFVMLLLAGMNGAIRAVNPQLGKYLFVSALVLPIMVFVVFYNLKPSTAEMHRYLTIAGASTAVIGWISLGIWIQTGLYRHLFRWDSQNAAGCFMGMVLPFSLVALVDAKTKVERILRLFVFGGILAGILVSQSGANLLSLVVAAGFLAWRDKRILKIMLPAILVSAIALPGLLIYRLMMLFGYGAIPDWSAVGRVQIWLNSLEYIPKYYLFGMGIDSFRILYPIDFPFSFIKANHVHNMYLKWLFDYGIFGMIGYLVIIGKGLARALRGLSLFQNQTDDPDYRILMGMTAGLISGLFASLVDATLHQTPNALIVWSMLAFILILVNRMKSKYPEAGGMVFKTGISAQ